MAIVRKAKLRCCRKPKHVMREAGLLGIAALLNGTE
jgi:hypothetical protein